MGEYTYSGVILSKGDVDFGIITPARRLFKLAVAVFDKNTFHVLQNLHTRQGGPTLEAQLSVLADGQVNAAKSLHNERFAPKVIPELLAYVRGLPEDCKSHAFDGDDQYMLELATGELTYGLVQALRFEDEYRAAVAMEKVVPYFIPDRELLPLLRGFIDEAKATFKARPLMNETAITAEKRLLSSSGMIRMLVDGIKGAEQPASSGYSVR
jgi:hypothetical protein